MLDVPIRLHGRFVGFLRSEQTGRQRTWTQEEERFAASLADFVSLSLISAEHVELETQLRQSQKMEAVGVLAGGVAHDFNNLLTAVLGYCDLLLVDDQLGDRVRRCVTEIRRAGEAASQLTRQLLAFSRKQILNPQLVDINGVIGEMDTLLRRLIGEEFSLCHVQSTRMGRIRVDPNQLEQIVLNLVLNARDSMPQGGPITIQTSMDAAEERTDQEEGDPPAAPMARLTVIDEGCGMDEATLGRAFEPFFTTKEKGRGTGLGLSTVYGIVQQSGGVIHIDSEMGRGTTVEVRFPIAEHAPATPEEADPPTAGVILVVEDQPQVLEFSCEVLREAGYQVLSATGGPEALAVSEARSGPIDLLLSDMVMPHMSGRDLGERILRARPGLKLLFMSGYTNGLVDDASELPGGAGFLQKPFRVAELLDSVRGALGRPARPIARDAVRLRVRLTRLRAPR